MMEKTIIKEINYFFKDKTILVTGGIGSVGESIVRALLALSPAKIRVLDNRETELVYARKKFSRQDNVRFFYGDVREKERLLKATQDVDIIYHAAALKHVLPSEYDPYEVIKTNVHGTQNVIEAAIANNVGCVILISTDKAVNPCSVMGTTKLLAERLIASMAHHKGKSSTKFAAVRFGNVLGSRGSVLEIWDRLLQEGKKISITDQQMTRFFMSTDDCVQLIFQATLLANEGETFIFKMNSVNMGDLADAYLSHHGQSPDNYEIIGKSPWEKDHEKLFFEEEREHMLESQDFFIRLPLVDKFGSLVDKSSSYYQDFLKKGFMPLKQNQALFSNDPAIMLQKDEINSKLLSRSYPKGKN